MKVPLRKLQRAADCFGLLSLALWCAFVVGVGSDAGVSAYVFIAATWGALPLLLLWALRFGAHLWEARIAGRRRIGLRLLEPVVIVLCSAAVLSGVAFRVRFYLSKPALDAFARLQLSGNTVGRIPGNRWVGLFHATETEVLPGGVVRLITSTCMFDHCGVVFSAAGRPPRIEEDHYSSLSGGWWHWRRSW